MAQKRYYKTATGKSIDLETMMLKNEDTIAVGNKFVNARGDELGTGGEVIRSREEVIQDYYRIHNGTIPQDRPIPEADEVVNTPEQVNKNKPTDLNKDPILAEIEANEPNKFVFIINFRGELLYRIEFVPEGDNLIMSESTIESNFFDDFATTHILTKSDQSYSDFCN